MKLNPLRLLALASLCAGVLVARSASAGSCTPDTNVDYCKKFDCAWKSASDNMDDVLIAQRCNAPDAAALRKTLDGFLNTEVNASYWLALEDSDGGVCTPNGYYSRLLNAMLATVNVQVATDNVTIPQSPYDWLKHVHDHTADEGMVADCFVGAKIATFYSDKPVHLRYQFFATQDPYRRAGVLAHEASHDWSTHLDGAVCPGAPSCDTVFGASNATTFGMRFNQHALKSFQRAPSSKELKRMNFGGGVCGYAPLLSPIVRLWAANDVAWRKNNNFVTLVSYAGEAWDVYASDDPVRSYGGWAYTFDDEIHARWKCGQVCDPKDYVSGGAQFCSNPYQEENTIINTSNAAACDEAIAKIGSGVTDAEYQKIASAFHAKSKACVQGVSKTQFDAFCTTAKEGANSVTNVESKWTLPDQPGYFDSGDALTRCTKSFCQERFNASWATPAKAACYAWSDDGLGCLDALCGSITEIAATEGPTSKSYFHALQCRRHFLESGGAPDAYDAAEQGASPCDTSYEACVDDAAYEAWKAAKATGGCTLASFAGPAPAPKYQHGALSLLGTVSKARFDVAYPSFTPDACGASFKACKVIEAFAAKTAAVAVAGAKLPAEAGGGPVGPDDYFVGRSSPADAFAASPLGALSNGVARAAVADRLGPAAYGKLFGASSFVVIGSTPNQKVVDRELAPAAKADVDALGALHVRTAAGAGKMATLDAVSFHSLMTALSGATTIGGVGVALDQAGIP